MAILEDVAEARQEWKRRGLEIDVSVNLSAASLEVPAFSDRMLEATQRLELPAKGLIFEVTESASTTRLGPFLANLAKLRMKGFRLSIDDFGAGFATFEQLERIPFTELKIDRSITYLLPQEARQLHMARRLIQMAKGPQARRRRRRHRDAGELAGPPEAGLRAGAGLFHRAPHAGRPDRGMGQAEPFLPARVTPWTGKEPAAKGCSSRATSASGASS